MEQRNMGDSVAGGKTFSGGRMDDVWNRDNMQARWWREKKKRTPRLFLHGFSVGGNSLLPPVAQFAEFSIPHGFSKLWSSMENTYLHTPLSVKDHNSLT